MKLKYEFETVDMDGETMAVPVGDNADDAKFLLRLNGTAAFILDALRQDLSEDDLVARVLEKYDGDEAEIRRSVHGYVEQLRQQGVVD